MNPTRDHTDRALLHRSWAAHARLLGEPRQTVPVSSLTELADALTTCLHQLAGILRDNDADTAHIEAYDDLHRAARQLAAATKGGLPE